MTADRRKLTPPQRAALELLAKIPGGIERRRARLWNRTGQDAPFCALIHTGTAENLARRGLVRIAYNRTEPGGYVEITPEGKAKLSA